MPTLPPDSYPVPQAAGRPRPPSADAACRLLPQHVLRTANLSFDKGILAEILEPIMGAPPATRRALRAQRARCLRRNSALQYHVMTAPPPAHMQARA